MIIGVLNQKGGVGKTTIATNLAAVCAKAGNRVLLVDADPQGSSMAWSAAREDDPLFPVISMAKPTLHKDLPELASDYDLVIIDGAPRVNDLARATILASDVVLIPVQPSPYDIWACADTVQLIQEAQQYKDGLRGVFVINRRIVGTAIGRDVNTALEQFGLPVLNAVFSQRVIYPESAAQGRAVIEVDPKSEAAIEVAQLAAELVQTKVTTKTKSKKERKAA